MERGAGHRTHRSPWGSVGDADVKTCRESPLDCPASVSTSRLWWTDGGLQLGVARRGGRTGVGSILSSVNLRRSCEKLLLWSVVFSMKVNCFSEIGDTDQGEPIECAANRRRPHVGLRGASPELCSPREIQSDRRSHSQSCL